MNKWLLITILSLVVGIGGFLWDRWTKTEVDNG